jgi:hypothetical protein
MGHAGATRGGGGGGADTGRVHAWPRCRCSSCIAGSCAPTHGRGSRPALVLAKDMSPFSYAEALALAPRSNRLPACSHVWEGIWRQLRWPVGCAPLWGKRAEVCVCGGGGQRTAASARPARRPSACLTCKDASQRRFKAGGYAGCGVNVSQHAWQQLQRSCVLLGLGGQKYVIEAVLVQAVISAAGHTHRGLLKAARTCATRVHGAGGALVG